MFLEDISGGKQVLRTVALCFTDAGQQLAERIPGLRTYRFGRDFSETRHLVKELLTDPFPVSAVVFFSSVGIAVRLIASYVVDKMTDPAVIVINDTAEFVIPILSGHAGRANELAVKLSELLEAKPVITTASDNRNGIEAPDLWAARHGYVFRNREDVKIVTAAMVAGGKPEIRYQGEIVIWSVMKSGTNAGTGKDVVTAEMFPMKYVIGLGCRKGTDPEKLTGFAEEKLNKIGIRYEQIFKVCSIDLKSDEVAILNLAMKWKRPFVVFSAEQLNLLTGDFSTSTFVEKTTGTNNVCERSALAGCAPWKGNFLIRKFAENGMTIAVAERQL